jgi:hypothetical protein
MERLDDEVEVVTVPKLLPDEQRPAWKKTLAGAVGDNGQTVEAGTN